MQSRVWVALRESLTGFDVHLAPCCVTEKDQELIETVTAEPCSMSSFLGYTSQCHSLLLVQ